LLILLVVLVWSSPAAADPGFVTDLAAQPAWPDGPDGAHNPIQPSNGKTIYIDAVNGSPTGIGTQADPADRISRGWELVEAGDTVIVMAGTYAEQVIPPDILSPLTLLADPADGTSVILDGSGLAPVTEGSLQNPAGVSLYRDGAFVIDGFLIQNWTGYGLAVQQGSDAIVRNCSFKNNGSAAADSVDLVVISSRDTKILSNSFDSNTERGLDDRAADTLIAHNYFSGHLNNAIKVGPHPAGQGSRIEHNTFVDNTAIQGVIYIQQAKGVAVQRNLLVDGNLQGIRLDDVEDSQIFMNTVVGFQVGLEIYRLFGCRVEGNILASNTLGVEILSLMSNSGLDANLYFDNMADVDGQGDAGPNALFDDPGFNDPDLGDYTLGDGAFALDKGPNDLPVPNGGGSRVDLGAFERGADLHPWNYNPVGQAADLTPAFSWTYTNREPADLPGGYRVQVDKSAGFDTEDLLDSGQQLGDLSSWTVPASFELTAGQWYVRVKTRDSDNNPGPWSDPYISFTVEAAPTCQTQGGTACAVLDACDGDWLAAGDQARCCLGVCVACPDGDSDGFLDHTCGGNDCNDSDGTINPDADEDCQDQIDNDCDQMTDLDDSECGCVDHDRDGYGENCPAGEDCDDTIAAVHPGAEELCNGVDDNCDDQIDEGFDLQSDPDNCGQCQWDCRGEQVCDLGECKDECGSGRTNCERACIDTTSDMDNCGGCGLVCELDHAAEKCTAGECILTVCETGWLDINGLLDDGCEYECTPSAEGVEVCGNNQDDNCDGQVDENCEGGGGCGCASTKTSGGLVGLLLLGLLVILRRRSANQPSAV